MKPPSKGLLLDFMRMNETDGIACISFAQSLHPNPVLFKSSWQIFTLASETEGWDFFAKEPRISTVACMAKLQELREKSVSFILYGGDRRPRKLMSLEVV